MVYAQEEEPRDNIIDKILRALFGQDANDIPPDVELPPEVIEIINGLSGTPVATQSGEFDNDSEFVYDGELPNLNLDEYALTTPDQSDVQTYLTTLRKQPWRGWASKCLYYEKMLRDKGVNLKPYLLCGWTWFDAGLNPYAVNCKDNGDKTKRQSPSFFCKNEIGEGDKNKLLQIGGFQAYDQASANNYTKYYQLCHGDKPLSEVVSRVFYDSDQQSNSNYSYPKQLGVTVGGYSLVKDFVGQLNSVDSSVIATSVNKMTSDPRSHFFTSLLGKDDCMRVGLNVSATNSIPAAIRAAEPILDDPSKKHWAKYVVRRKKEFSAMVVALAEFDKENKESGGSSGSDTSVTPPPSGGSTSQGCPAASENITAPETSMKLLTRRDKCIQPTMVVIHWTVGWISPDTTMGVLNSRGLSCQFATGTGRQLQGLYMFDNLVERAACVKRYGNTISIEISGDSFDSVYNNTNHPKYNELKTSTAIAVRTTCWALKQYKIPNNQVYGHLELNPEDKSDPGKVYIDYFRKEVNKLCPNAANG